MAHQLWHFQAGLEGSEWQFKEKTSFFDRYNANLIFGDLINRDITFIATGSEVEIAYEIPKNII